MTTTTASSVDIPSDNDLPLSAHLTEPAEPAIDTSDITVTPDTSAQSAAYRLGGKRSRLWHPSSDRRSLIFKVSSVLVYCLFLGAVLFLWLTVRQQQIQLTTLDAAFRSGQLQTLPDRMQAIEDRQQQFVPKLQGEKWQLRLSEQELRLTAFEQQLSSLVTEVKETQAATARAVAREDETGMKLDAVHKALTEQTSRIDTLASWKDTWSKRTVATATKATPSPGGGQSAAKKSSKPRVIKPPFTLVSIERRGGQAYAVILPAGNSGWTQLRMVSPGESLSGWVLVNISGNQAEFQVNGQVQRLTL
ncbi:TPA_asm: hypothetical protein GDL21_10105 [Salmonella enterica]|uniref:Plasmid transfer protein n=3 Tax=Salmonella enterica TaxID=28901 RepID=A0A6W0BRZ3_SALER|nr:MULTISPECIES: hypothetical protein [Enterobacteriaceae]EAA2638278.1 hypothetical protein [Salmonella enterica subsp. enterica serovar Typhimurium]ECX5973470.1 hypothetical protein [Salmonella enterica subsp. enterica serovar Montevideo]ECZ7717609.1 hypothetical protein [Salmonella enterica subsp. enterica serovar Newport]EDB1997014.1 hypothetical protein [Salmonella enterica subsp. enterica serovar Haifa]HCS9483253.1 hypothetical protein [Salmonella enterica subsp. enterica serovar 1,4,[5],